MKNKKCISCNQENQQINKKNMCEKCQSNFEVFKTMIIRKVTLRIEIAEDIKDLLSTFDSSKEEIINIIKEMVKEQGEDKIGDLWKDIY